MKTIRILDPESPESLRITLFLWRLKKAALPAIVASAIALIALFANTVGPMVAQKGPNDRLITKIQTKIKHAAYEQVGPYRVRVEDGS
jgi:hypothetical protein